MSGEDMFRSLVAAFFGVRDFDEYPLKEYVMQDLKNYIEKYVWEHPIPYFDYEKEARLVEDLPMKNKLQDCLLILPRLSVSMEFILMIKKKLRDLAESENF